MKGLLRNSFYGAIGSARITLIFFAAIGLFLIINVNEVLLQFFVLSCSIVFGFNALSSVRKESATNWNKYVITAPVQRKDIVKSRYINHALWTLIGVVVAALFLGLSLLIHGNYFSVNIVRAIISLFSLGIGIPLLMGCIFYPLIYLIESDKSEIIMGISLLGAVGITLGLIWLLNFSFGMDSVSDIEFFLGMVLYVGFVLLLFIISFFITVRVNRKKEY